MITLYTAGTGNGQRASILLEEMALPYRRVTVDFASGGHRDPAFLSVNPLGKIPVIVDDDGPGGEPITVAESLAIALYLVEKTGLLNPPTPAARAVAWTWGSAVASGLGALFSGVFYARQTGAEAHAAFIAKSFADIDFQFAAMEAHLSRNAYLAGDAYSWVDALAVPIVGTAERFDLSFADKPAISRWSEAVLARPAVQRGMAPEAGR